MYVWEIVCSLSPVLVFRQVERKKKEEREENRKRKWQLVRDQKVENAERFAKMYKVREERDISVKANYSACMKEADEVHARFLALKVCFHSWSSIFMSQFVLWPDEHSSIKVEVLAQIWMQANLQSFVCIHGMIQRTRFSFSTHTMMEHKAQSEAGADSLFSSLSTFSYSLWFKISISLLFQPPFFKFFRKFSPLIGETQMVKIICD